MDKSTQKKYTLGGMDCPGCANTIEKYCKKIPGVQIAEVNFSTSILKLNCDSDETRIKIETGVQKLGFSIKEFNPLNSTSSLSPQKTRTTQNETLKNKFKKLNHLPPSSHSKNKNNKQEHSHDHNHAHDKNFISILILIFVFIAFSIVKYFYLHLGFYLFNALALYCIYPVLKKVIQYFKVQFYFSVEFLMFVAVIGALFINKAQEAAMVMVLFSIGEALEGYTSKKASRGIEKLSSLIPNFAHLVLKDGSIQEINASEILTNQVLLIKASERFPSDGIIIEGETYIDESLLTGEALPVHKKLNEKVVAGSLNTQSSVKILTSQVGSQHSVARLIQLVQDAQGTKSKTLRSIENFSRYYTPIILVIGLLTAIVPPLLGITPWLLSIYKGLAILLIGCPCALIISTPSAIAAGISTATKFGILIKHASALEIIGKVKTFAFDKTGTLTEGKLKVTDIFSFSPEYNEEEIFLFAFSLEEHSTHPLAKSILLYAKDKNISSHKTADVKTLSGIGLSGKINENNIYITSPSYAIENSLLSNNEIQTLENLQNEGKTICLIILEKKVIGLLAFQDKLKEDAQQALTQLKNLNIIPIILTGDHKRNAEAVTSSLNIKIMSQLLPENKLKYIQEFSQNGKVAMVGDGINDAPALAAADVGIAMGEGTDVAIDSAQIVIANKNISSLVFAVKISRKTLNIISQNIFIALVLKLFFLIVVFMGIGTLWMAILADTGATVFVTLNSMRLLRYNAN